MMEITPIHNNELTPLMNNKDDDENHKPSEKSVETNASTSSVPMDDDQLPLLFGHRQQQRQRMEKRGRDVLPTGYEIRIDAAAAVGDDCCDNNVRDGKGGGDVTKLKQQLDVSFDVLNDVDKVVTALDQLDVSDKFNVHNGSGSMTTSREKQSASPQSSSPVLSAIVNNTTETDFEEDDLEYEWTPPRHIYALRKIIVDYHTVDGGFCGNKDEVYHDSCGMGGSSNNSVTSSQDNISTTSQQQHLPPSTPRPESPPDTHHHPIKQQRKSHIISSQMVNISGYENTKLEEISKGSVLCSHWMDDENEEEQWSNKVRSVPKVCTTKCDTEEIITIVPNTLARRRMGCNCVEGCEVLEDGDDDDDVMKKKKKKKKKKSRRVYSSWRTIKRTVFCQLKRRGSNYSSEKSQQEGDDYCPRCNVFGAYHVDRPLRKEKRVKKRRNRSSLTMRNVGEAIYGDESVLSNSAEPVNDILSIDSSLGIYICESGLTAAKCQEIIDAAECLAQHKGAWSAYTYAKQTLGCKEYDDLAEASGEPVMTACATVVDRLNEIWEASGNTDESDDGDKRQSKVDVSKSGNDVKKKKKKLVLDVREPHVVKYDLSRMERRKLDMHTDRSVWTFIIALSEGRGQDYCGGGTFFEKLNATVHLQRGQMIIFRGKLRHRGVKITYGKRYLLVGFLVEQEPSALNRE